ncbi:MAG: type I pantothenate kinase [Chloroflexi bacterium]|nr:MAG: type I pantothenate kinase [Chloroflexota bacterium]
MTRSPSRSAWRKNTPIVVRSERALTSTISIIASTPFIDFSKTEWARLRASTPLTLTDADLADLRGINERLDLEEVVTVYLPLSRLLNLQVAAAQALHQATATFLGAASGPAPYVLGIAGSVAVGKSTTARILQALLARWPSHPRVDLVATDSFLYPNRILEERGILNRKGFPESYDQRALVQFVADVKAGVEEVKAPVYSHLIYDLVPDQAVVVRRPDVLILEGLNVLQAGGGRLFVSDYFDFSIYVDAREGDIQRWYEERFLALRETAFRDPSSYFRRFGELSEREAVATARRIWTEINGLNLRENILPTRERARLILEKGPDHLVRTVRLRKL